LLVAADCERGLDAFGVTHGTDPLDQDLQPVPHLRPIV
jgi:hypothetical protein